MGKKKSSKGTADNVAPTSTSPTGSSLVICRNKHWRYISSFHGPWLHLPPEILDSLAHQNWIMPSPRLIDPSVFFDVVKIRKSVDEAAEACVRAATGISNNAMTGRMDYFGAGGGPASKLSKERIFKIRQKAVRLLVNAFTLDEVATSVATMQATSTLEDVGEQVLKRESQNRDAKYVHYFQEKIPSRAVDLFTPLEPLNEVINAVPWEEAAPYYRTRAIVQTFKYEWEGAAADLTTALRIVEELKSMHNPGQQQLEFGNRMNVDQKAWSTGQKDWRSVPRLKDEDQPTSLEMQLLFNRGNVYLNMATLSIDVALDGLKEHLHAAEKGEMSEAEAAAQAVRVEARAQVKKYAKRALKDFMSFLSHLEYTPGLPQEFASQIIQQMNDLAANGGRLAQAKNGTINGTHTTNGATALVKRANSGSKNNMTKRELLTAMKPIIYTANMLFAEKPPLALPPFPREHEATLPDELSGGDHSLKEAITYHPLLTDVLHTILLTHCLLQTSATELLRHACNAARLISIADGYPIFQPAISPARGGWRVVLRKADNWIGLASSWSELCAGQASRDMRATSNTSDRTNGRVPVTRDLLDVDVAKEKKLSNVANDVLDSEANKIDSHQSIDIGGSLAKATNGARLTSLDEFEFPLPKTDDHDGGKDETSANAAESRIMDTERQYPFSIERAETIARWVNESPLSLPGPKKRKPRPKKPVRKVQPAETDPAALKPILSMVKSGHVEYLG